MIDFIENSTKIGRSNLDGISLGKKKVKIRLALKNEIEGQVFIWINIFYLPNSSFYFVSLDLLNNAGI